MKQRKQIRKTPINRVKEIDSLKELAFESVDTLPDARIVVVNKIRTVI